MTTIVVQDPRDRSQYRAKLVTARKRRPCSFCKAMIFREEQYGRTRDFHSSRTADYSVCLDHRIDQKQLRAHFGSGSNGVTR